MSKRAERSSESARQVERVAVIANPAKSLGGGLEELRERLADAGHDSPLWYEVSKSSKAPRALERAVAKGADLVFVWGGDGLVQRVIDSMGDQKRDLPIAILPAGTGNLLANNLKIPLDLPGAIECGLSGVRQRLDVGVLNGERFAVMAGTGADAITMRDVTKTEKARVGRLAYFRSAAHALTDPAVQTDIRVDGKRWFSGKASCVLLGNVGAVTGGIEVFPEASPLDGKLEVAVFTADTTFQWARVFAAIAAGRPARSRFVRTTRAKKVTVKTEVAQPYELDGGDRKPTKKLKFKAEADAVTVCLPKSLAENEDSSDDATSNPAPEAQ